MKTPDNSPNPFSSSSAIDNAQPQESSSLPPTARDIFAVNAQVNQAPKRAKGTRANKPINNSIYKPSGRIAPYGVPLLVLWTLPASTLVGFAYWLFTQYWNPVFFAQIFLGFALGAAMFPAIRLAKCRNTKIAVGAAVLLSVLTLVMWHALEARDLRSDYVDYVTKLGVQSGVPEATAHARAEAFLTPTRTARAYLRTVTRYGVTLRDEDSSHISGSSQGGTRVVGAWYWLMQAFELLIAAVCAAAIAQGAASARFSEACDRWYRKSKFASVAPSRVVELMDLMKDSRWREAGQLVQKSRSESTFSLTIYDCAPASDGFVALMQTANNQTACLFESVASQQDIALLRNPN